MFFTPTLKSDLFYVHKAAQCLMIILLLATLVMPILHQPPKAEAVALTTVVGVAIIIGVVIAGGALLLNWIQNKPNPCPAESEGCQNMVKYRYEDRKDCENCFLFVWGCIATYPTATEDDPLPYHRVPSCSVCNKPYFLCHKATSSTASLGEQLDYHGTLINSDCGNLDHEYYQCLPIGNHELLSIGDAFLCSHDVYECTADAHQDVFCEACSNFHAACEYTDHVCRSSTGDGSSGCCSTSSGCCSTSSGCCSTSSGCCSGSS